VAIQAEQMPPLYIEQEEALNRQSDGNTAKLGQYEGNPGRTFAYWYIQQELAWGNLGRTFAYWYIKQELAMWQQSSNLNAILPNI
jgi:hypothetical protein